MTNLSVLLGTSDVPFEHDWGLDNPPSELQQLVASYYDAMADQFETVTRMAFEEDVLGSGNKGYMLLEDLVFLLFYLMIINGKMAEYRLSSECGILPPRGYLIEEYSLDCIRKTFLCKGINVDKVLRMDILPALKEFDLASNASDTGIDFMFIEGSGEAGCDSHETFFVS